jgi:hypothetical protein
VRLRSGNLSPHHGQNRMRIEAVPPSWIIKPYSLDRDE